MQPVTHTQSHVAPIIRYCLDCDEPISLKRLAAVPNAEYCVRCQPRHDDVIVAIHRPCSRFDELDATDFERVPKSRTAQEAELETVDMD